MEKCKADRLARERRALLRARIDIVSNLVGKYAFDNPTQIIPEIADICLLSKELRDLILETDAALIVDESSFDNWLITLPDICQEWRRSKDAFLLQLLTSSTSDSPASSTNEPVVSRFDLATTYFGCKQCSGLILYPRILAHSCMTFSGMTRSTLQADLDTEELWRALIYSPWNHTGDKLRLHEEAFNAAREVVLAAGNDPLVTTASQMDQLDARFSCQVCFAGRFAMNWRGAVCILLFICHPLADIFFSRSHIVLGRNMQSYPGTFWTKRLLPKSKYKRRISRSWIQVDITVVFDAARLSPIPGGTPTC